MSSHFLSRGSSQSRDQTWVSCIAGRFVTIWAIRKALVIFAVVVQSLSLVWRFATPWTAAYQAPPSMGFSRQEYWSGLPLAFPRMLSGNSQIILSCESEVTQSCPTLCDPMGCSLPGSSVHRIFQAIVLEWIAISFSRGSSQPRDRTWVSHIVDRSFTIWATREVRDSPILSHRPSGNPHT